MKIHFIGKLEAEVKMFADKSNFDAIVYEEHNFHIKKEYRESLRNQTHICRRWLC